MSIENSPRIRQRAQLERKQNKRASYDRILIVCEGEKTEPLYFEEIRQFYKLQTANVKVAHSTYGTSPLQIVECSLDECLRTKKWEQVYCVFDRDDHLNFNNALQKVNALNDKYRNDLKQPIKFNAIQSNPCFELWLLLHFECVTRHSHGTEIIRLLSQLNRIKDYGKGQPGHFNTTKDNLNTAFINAATLKAGRDRLRTENPYTNVDELVSRLIHLGKLPCA